MSRSQLAPALVACLAAYGAHLVYTSVALRWKGVMPGPTTDRRRGHGVPLPRLTGLSVRAIALGAAGALAAIMLFGTLLPAAISGALCTAIAVVSSRAELDRRQHRIAAAWPAILDETRVLAGAAGRPIPQALFEVGRRAAPGVREAFGSAQREWQASTDFGRALGVLKAELAEPSSDVICETLLVAHQVGGSGVDRRLEALVDDRVRELDLRRDAASRQAGARFARKFVLIVPVGMALVGLSLGTGRAAYASGTAQAIVAVALAVIAVCWVWAGRILRLPRAERLFT
jgi:tight adherence protein B